MKPCSQKIFSNAFFILYTVIIIIGITHHELWGDEIHSWNIAKSSVNFTDLLSNIRYEGHPPLWYILLWLLSKITHNVIYIQWLHLFIILPVAFCILFYSPFPFVSKILILLGYYFIFEYSVLSRNYALGLLLILCICLIQYRNFPFKYILYYLLLFLLANVHLLACVLGASLHLSFLFDKYFVEKKLKSVFLHGLVGFLVLLPALISIFPPSNSGLNMDFWFARWSFKNSLLYFQAIYKAFLPMPAWWKHHFWNSYFIIELYEQHGWLRIVTYSLSILFSGILVYIISSNRKGFVILISNLVLTLCISQIFPLTSARYVGYIFVGFLIACWFGFDENSFGKRKLYLINLLLFLQIVPGIYTICMDIKYPFSNAEKVKDLVASTPQGNLIITDYWCLNKLSAFLDMPFYCVELKEKRSFILWDEKLTKARKSPNLYSGGVSQVFRENPLTNRLYLISINDLNVIQTIDSSFQDNFNIKLLKQYEGAIESKSNVYLYQIVKKNNSLRF